MEPTADQKPDPALNPSDAGTSGTTPAPAADSSPTTTPSASSSQAQITPPAPRPKPIPKAIVAPIVAPSPSIELAPAQTQTPEYKPVNYIPTLIGAIAAGTLGTFLYLKLKNKNNKKQNDKKCLNIKKLMEDKLNGLTDLKGKLKNFANEKAREGAREAIAGTEAEKILKLVETGEKEYARLKELYEKCITSIDKGALVFIFHGTEGHPEENWFPWLKGKLKGAGKESVVPQFPSPKNEPAKITEWHDVFKKYEDKINENSVLVAHSLGGIFVLRLLEKLKHPVKTVVFVGTPIGEKPILNYDRDNSFSGFDFDWENIRNKAKNFIVFHSDNDPYVSLANGEKLARELGVQLNLIPGAGHFNEKAGYLEFPELLERLKPLL